MASRASGPVAETLIVVPGPAASIISPMIEVPPTVSLPRVTQTSALKRSTIWTNFADARACSPRLLMIRSSWILRPRARSARVCFPATRRRRSFAGEDPAGDRDVFAARLLGHCDRVGKRSLFTYLGKLDQHGKVDAREHFHLGTAHAGNCEVGGRTAEHVGQDCNAVAGVYAVDRFDNVAATEIGIIFGADRHRFNLFLRTHDMFERRLELVGEAPVGHQY